MKIIALIGIAFTLASCAGSFQLLPDGTIVVDPDPIVIAPEK